MEINPEFSIFSSLIHSSSFLKKNWAIWVGLFNFHMLHLTLCNPKRNKINLYESTIVSYNYEIFGILPNLKQNELLDTKKTQESIQMGPSELATKRLTY